MTDQTSPRTYLSTSAGKYRVISQGSPISADKDTPEAALAACKAFTIWVEQPTKMWNGDTGRFEGLP